MNSAFFDIEHLQQLTYERSKAWACFFDNVAEKDVLAEVDLNKLEEVFGPKCDVDDTSDELASMEDEKYDEEVLDAEALVNITRTARLSFFLNNNKTLCLPDTAKNGENNQLLDILNQTMPIINEHNRQLKESGIDRILSTFDKQKIEEKVGSWLSRHNSLYGGDNSMLVLSSKEDYKQKCKTLSASAAVGSRYCRNRTPISKEFGSDSDDSLQSGDTARYIRSSRAGAVKNSAHTTTMIKTYRMVKSTRDALRQKYACEQNDYECHLRTLRQRRRFDNEMDYNHNPYNLARLQSQRKHDLPPSFGRERRKLLCKRTCTNSCSNLDSSSDSDYFDGRDQRFNRKRLASCCQYHCSTEYHKNILSKSRSNVVKKDTQRSTIKMPTSRMNRIYYSSHLRAKTLSTSSSSASFNSTCENIYDIKKNFQLHADNKPCRRESECSCSNNRQLCKEYKHFAETSTEEWFVENYYSPKKQKTPSSHSNSCNSLTYDTEKLSVVSGLMDKETKQKIEKVSNKKQSTIKEKTEKKNTNLESETSFDRQLQMAIKASKETHKREQQIKNTLKKKTQKNEIFSKPSKNTTKRQYKKILCISDTDTGDELELFEKLPKLVLKKHNDENVIHKKISTNKQKNSIGTKREDTFFANSQSQVICNSTALSSKSQAYSRQISEELEVKEKESNKKIIVDNNSRKKQKKKENENVSTYSMDNLKSKTVSARGMVTSTTIRSSEVETELNLTNLQGRQEIFYAESSNDDPSDCALVTSTTNIEIPVTSETKQELQQQDSTLTSNNEQTEKGILIYAPENRYMAPAHSFTSDGHFIITKEHLSRVIGEKPAEKFLKYYIGRKRFNSTSSVYFRPPATGYLDADNGSSSSDSDDDLDNMGQYGDLYESINKTKGAT